MKSDICIKAYVTIGQSTCVYYSDIPIEKGDSVVLSTKHGNVKGKVLKILDLHATRTKASKQHVLENITKQIIHKECIIMGNKTVLVRHINSNRTSLLYTDLKLANGDMVVYESHTSNADIKGMHVGVVVNTDPDTAIGANWVVCKIDMTQHKARQERELKLAKLKERLEIKRKQFADIELLKLIASTDKETASMLDEYIKLLSNPLEENF